MSADRPERLTDRITELWNDRPRADRSPVPQSADSPSDRFPDRPPARFSDLEPVTPVSVPSPPASTAPGPSLAPAPTSGPGPTRIRAWAPQPSEPTPRAVGSPLPTGTDLSAPTSSPDQPVSSRAAGPALPGKNLALGRGLSPAQSPPAELPSGIQRAVNAFRATLPFIQRILPLLDGNVGTAVSNLMAPPPHRPAPPPPPVDLAPLEEGISSLQNQQHDLRAQIADQNTSLKRVEDQLEMVREATDRNTLEQQELLEDLKGVGNKVNIFAMVALLLLVVSVMVNVILYLHIKRVLP